MDKNNRKTMILTFLTTSGFGALDILSCTHIVTSMSVLYNHRLLRH